MREMDSAPRWPGPLILRAIAFGHEIQTERCWNGLLVARRGMVA